MSLTLLNMIPPPIFFRKTWSLFAQLWASLGALTAGCLPAVRPGQAQSIESPLTLSSSAPQLHTLQQWGELSVNQRTINQRSSVQCWMSDMRTPESRAECCWRRWMLWDSHINSMKLISIQTDRALMLDNCVFGYSRFKYQIKIEYLVLTNKCRVNFLNQRSILLQKWSQLEWKSLNAFLRSSSNCSQNVKA